MVQLVPPLLLMPSPHPAARVAIDESSWQAFRQAALLRGIPVSAYLGKLVESELKRRRATPLAQTREQDPPPDVALDALATVRASIDELDDIAGRLARTAVGAGGSWQEVGVALGLKPDVARSVYGAGHE
jgi:hypothetical protein